MAPRRCFEFLVQVAAMVVSAGAFIGALFTEIKLRDLSSAERHMIEVESTFLQQNELLLKTETTAGLVFATTGLLAVIGFIALVGRIFNMQHKKRNKRIFTSLVSLTSDKGYSKRREGTSSSNYEWDKYLLFVLLCFSGFAAAGILGVFTTIDWSDILSSGFNFNFVTEVENIRNSIAATSAISLLAALLFIFLELVVLFCCAASKDY